MDPLVDIDTLAAFDAALAAHPRAPFLLEQVSAAIRNYCGWHIAPLLEDQVLVEDGSGANVQMLPTLHIVEVTAVVDGGQVLDVSADLEWSEAGFLTRERGTCWTSKLRGVRVTLDHGYAETPPEVRGVVFDALERGTSPTGVVREQKGPFSVTYSQAGFNQAAGANLLPAELGVLDRYRISNRP